MSFVPSSSLLLSSMSSIAQGLRYELKGSSCKIICVRSSCGLKPGFYLTLDEQDNKSINHEGKHKDNNGPSDSSRPPSYATCMEAEPSFNQ